VADRDLGEGTRLAALTGTYICFEDEAGQALRPKRARTWAPRGHTPAARVSGRSGRLSVAGIDCLKTRAFTKAREDWLTVELPGYAPGLNAVESAWPVMKSGLGNHAARTLDELEAIIRALLRQIQRQPDLIQRAPRPDRTDPRPAAIPWPFNFCSAFNERLTLRDVRKTQVPVFRHLMAPSLIDGLR
jgi:transposase